MFHGFDICGREAPFSYGTGFEARAACSSGFDLLGAGLLGCAVFGGSVAISTVTSMVMKLVTHLGYV